MQRASAHAAGGDLLAAGCRQLVVVRVHLDHASVHEVARGVVEREAAHVERPQVQAGAALQHPLGHHLPGAAAGCDAVEEAGGDVVVVQLRHAAHHEVGVGRVGDRAVQQGADAGGLEARSSLGSQLGELREPVEVRLEQLPLEGRGDAAVLAQPGAERDRVWFVAADQQAGPVGLVVDEVVGVAHRRHLAELDRRVALDRAAQQVLVLHRGGGDAHAGHAAHLHAPHSGSVDQHLALDVAAGGVHGGAMAAVDGDRGDLRLLVDLGATHARAAGDRLGDRRRVDVAVGGQEGRGEHVLRAHQREQLLGTLRRDDLHRQPEALRHRGQPLQFQHPLGRAGQAQAAGLVPVHGLAGLGLQPAIHLHRLLEHAGGVARGTQLADETGSVPGGAVGEMVLFDQHDVALAVLGEPVGDAAAKDAAADDDDAGAGGERCARQVAHRGQAFTRAFVGS